MNRANSSILVLGGYGLIGAEICRALKTQGHTVIVAGRSQVSAKSTLPSFEFRRCDLHQLVDPIRWKPLLEGVDVVVNAAGALQDGPHDALEIVHHQAVAALAAAAKAQDIFVVQISAAGVTRDASTAFFRTKAKGDEALIGSGARHVVLRPGLVLAQSAYGGTALIRMLAAVPFVQPVTMAKSRIRTVGAPDVAVAVVLAVEGRLPAGFVADLVERDSHSLAHVIDAHRAALGFAPAPIVRLPKVFGWVAAKLSDQLARLGWRSPLRTTALKVMEDGVDGDPEPWAKFGEKLPELEMTLANLHFGTEHRTAARVMLLRPIAVAVLSAFWVASGVIGIWQITDASKQLTNVGWSAFAAHGSVAIWSIVDIALGLAILWRPFAQRACLAMVAVCMIYGVSAAFVTPHLWADPLGPMVKILPAALLALFTAAVLDER